MTKSVSPARARPGQRVTYTITVVNNGPDIAYDVVATEVRAAGTGPLKLHTTRGKCEDDRPARCSIGTLRPDQRAVITATGNAGARGRETNRVAVVSSTGDPDLSDNVAHATLLVSRLRA